MRGPVILNHLMRRAACERTIRIDAQRRGAEEERIRNEALRRSLDGVMGRTVILGRVLRGAGQPGVLEDVAACKRACCIHVVQSLASANETGAVAANIDNVQGEGKARVTLIKRSNCILNRQ